MIDEVERDALDQSVRISSPLRKLVALGGQAGSAELREWAGLELRSYYGSEVPLPEYRKVAAPILIDAATFNGIVTGQPISPSELPDPVYEHVDESVPLDGGVAEIEAMIGSARNEGGAVKLGLPKGQDVVRLMNHEMQRRGQGDQVIRIYWAVSPVALEGVIDQIRTRLVELVAEMRAEMPEEADVPTADVATNAVNVILGKRARATINTAQSAGDGSTASVTPPTQSKRSAWVTIGAFIVGLAGVVAAAVGVAAWLGWNPF